MKPLLILALFLILPAAVRAEDERGTAFELLLGPAFSRTKITLNSEDDLASNGLALGARFLGKVAPNVSFGAELQTLNMGEHTSNVLITNGHTTSKFDSLLFLAEAKIAAASGSVRPFGIAGLGFHSTSMKIDSTPQAGFVWTNTGTRETRSVVDSRKTAAAMTLQGGLDFPVNDRLNLGISLAWYYLAEATYDSTAVARQTMPSFLGVKGSLTGSALLASASYKF